MSMTEQEAPHGLLANGGRVYENEIQSVDLHIEGQELTFKRAAKQLRVLADMVEAGMMNADGFNWKYGGEYQMNVETPPSFPHGDYQDREGNLVHVGANDHIVSVVWANKDAETEDMGDKDVHAFEWIREHGPLRPAGSGEAHPHGDHEH
jgi:predicted metallo-beta-lactamase superfamily hydrolase